MRIDTKRKPISQYERIKVLNGGVEVVNIENILGYCNYAEHTGYITKQGNAVKGCRDKQCKYFTLFANYPCSKNYESVIENKKAQKDLKKRWKNFEKEKEQQLEDFKQDINDHFKHISEQFLVCGLYYIKEDDIYRIHYVSNSRKADAMDFVEVMKYANKILNKRVKLNHIKNENGYFMTIEEYRDLRL